MKVSEVKFSAFVSGFTLKKWLDAIQQWFIALRCFIVISL